MDSISSPKNSIRTGESQSGAKTSTMPPRTENSPGNSTADVSGNPLSASQLGQLRNGQGFADAERSGSAGPSSRGSGTGCKRPWMLVTPSFGGPLAAFRAAFNSRKPFAEDFVVDRPLRAIPRRETAPANAG